MDNSTTSTANRDAFLAYALSLTAEATVAAWELGCPTHFRVNGHLTLRLPTPEAWSHFLGNAPLSTLREVHAALEAAGSAP